ncbi:MAG: HprK-related kinase A [Magnetococcales bacterium]|nr:HprK-related kinase A [Magnetococcales bacterium]
MVLAQVGDPDPRPARVGDLDPGEVRRRLRGPGLRWASGPFHIHLHAPVPELERPLLTLYGSHPLLSPPWEEIADFHIRLDRGRGLRRWYRPQVFFRASGSTFFSILAPFPLDHAFPLFEWGLNLCIAARANQFLILHSGVMARGDQAVLLSGTPGSGKSTLCAALALRGWRLLSDEFALLRPADGRLQPVVRPVALKNASIPVIRAFAPGAVLGPVYPNTRKGTVTHLQPSPASVAAALETARPLAMISPRFQAGAALAWHSLSPRDGFIHLARNAFNYEVQGAQGFRAIRRLVAECALLELTYGDLEEAVTAIDARMSALAAGGRAA